MYALPYQRTPQENPRETLGKPYVRETQRWNHIALMSERGPSEDQIGRRLQIMMMGLEVQS